MAPDRSALDDYTYGLDIRIQQAFSKAINYKVVVSLLDDCYGRKSMIEFYFPARKG